MGCGQTLFVGDGGHVTCSYALCPRSDAVDEILADRETEHVVVLAEETFSVQHPLRERLDDELFTCPLHEWLQQQDGPPEAPGRYRVREPYGDSIWEPLA
ncbi:hypothetical protein A6V29_04940 [Blastococcus sp. CCUG 61487]|nr:hypothetical protein A6V29_04940 [Blastococcus sp. CCUG 61487]